MTSNLDREYKNRAFALRSEIRMLGGEANPAARPLIAELVAVRSRARVERTVSRARPVEEVRSAPVRESRPAPIPRATPPKTPWSRMRELPGQPHRLGPMLRSLARDAVERMPAASDAVREIVTRRLDGLSGDQAGPLSTVVLALSDPEYLRAWCKVARDPFLGERALTREERLVMDRAEHAVRSVRAMSLTDVSGGYMVPLSLDPGLVVQSAGNLSQLRRVARQAVATTDVWRAPTAQAGSWSYDAEAAQVSDDSPTVGLVEIPLHRASGYVQVSLELMQDATNFTQQVTDLMAFGRAELEAQGFITGTGTGQPVGIVTALTGSASEVPAGTLGSITPADLYALLDSLPGRHAAARGTAWLASPEVYSAIRQINKAGGADLWTTTPDGPLLLDRPALVAEGMSDELDGPVLIVGNFENFVLADRLPTLVSFVPHVPGANGRPSGQHGWLAMARHGAGVTNVDAFRMLVA